MKKIFLLSSLLLLTIVTSCISTKNTIRNIDDSAIAPTLLDENTYKITVQSTDKKYGYDKNYPIHVGFTKLEEGPVNQRRFLNALAGPNGEKIKYERLFNCCPFPSKKSELGSGLLDQYKITWEGQEKPIMLYLDMYEKGQIMIPVGLTVKQK
ncbi:2-dehydro-3-deoxyphosphooctonate aldolase [Flavobacterium sp. '19STA2R22 D10 B1']|uniref:2-dehydro-3-deoxyphosphooctonate aldolase n=1 Tax=Flavobacterium aerium TaxID=3037261 RepID=UPI00278BF064|nr:2-dehydro-3-deoxyphosphooctonate aldolase [Flavobacterium sp. '19STA2R22 D10 B1']